MNRIIIITVFLFMLSFSVQAQNNSTGITGYGFKIGGGFADISTNINEFKDIGNSARPIAGLFLIYNFSPQLAIQPELHYSGKGAVETDLLWGESGFDLSYIEVPVLLKYYIPSSGSIKPSLYMGPAMGILLSAQLKHFFDDDYDIKDGMKSTDFCFVFGFDMEIFKLSGAMVALDLRYTHGIVNVVDPTEWNKGRIQVGEDEIGPFSWADYNRPLLEDNAELKTRVLALAVRFRF